jgi:hypothetical protein
LSCFVLFFSINARLIYGQKVNHWFLVRKRQDEAGWCIKPHGESPEHSWTSDSAHSSRRRPWKNLLHCHFIFPMVESVKQFQPSAKQQREFGFKRNPSHFSTNNVSLVSKAIPRN